MKIHVEMTAEEFQEFMQWKKDKGIYGAELDAVELVDMAHEYFC